jgi:hypothetical protein
LNEISEEYNIQYSFNYVKLSENNNVEEKDMLYSGNLTLESIYSMVNNHFIIKDRLETLSRLLNSGKLIVYCHNDSISGQINEGDNYEIEYITYDENGNSIYKFKGKCSTFPSNSFILLSNMSLN